MDDGEGGAMIRHAGRRIAGATGNAGTAGLGVIVMALTLMAGCGHAPGSTSVTDVVVPVSTLSSTTLAESTSSTPSTTVEYLPGWPRPSSP